VICYEEKFKTGFKFKKKKKTWFFKKKCYKSWEGSSCKQEKERACPNSSLMGNSFSSLKKERDIQAVFLERTRLSNRNFIFYYKFNLNKGIRVVFFVPKRVFKRAWDRNRTRRILREVFRNYSWDNRGLDIVCIVRTLESKMLSLKEVEPLCQPLLRDIV